MSDNMKIVPSIKSESTCTFFHSLTIQHYIWHTFWLDSATFYAAKRFKRATDVYLKIQTISLNVQWDEIQHTVNRNDANRIKQFVFLCLQYKWAQITKNVLIQPRVNRITDAHKLQLTFAQYVKVFLLALSSVSSAFESNTRFKIYWIN